MAPIPKKKPAPVSPAPAAMVGPAGMGDPLNPVPHGPPGGAFGLPAPASQVLKTFGFTGTIYDFNDRVQAVVDTHKDVHRLPPSPGLVFDVARSGVLTKDIPHLIKNSPVDKAGAERKNVLKQSAADGDLLMVHPTTGQLVKPNNPFQNLIPRMLSNVGHPRSLDEMYPTTVAQMGVLPVPHFDGLVSAIGTIDRYVGKGTITVRSQGMTLADLRQMVKDLPGSDLERAGSPYAPGAVGAAAGVSPTEAAMASARGQSDAAVVAAGASRTKQELTHAINTVAKAQRDLNQKMGTTLPVTGWFNDDWRAAISNYLSTQKYREQLLGYQAEHADFGTDTAGYVRAFEAKQKQVAAHGGVAGQFLNHMPLRVFAHHGFLGVLEGVGESLTNAGDKPWTAAFWSHPATSTLHPLVRSATLALDVVGGAVDEAKAQTAGVHAAALSMIQDVTRGQPADYEQAIRKWKQQVNAENPSWLKVFYPDIINYDHNRYVRAVDQITNVAGDLILLRKPVFTGERVAAGSLRAARSSSYLQASSHWAFGSLKEGDLGQAALHLGNTTGGERLARAALPLVKKGEMNEDQFREHLAELYATGNTTVNVRGVPVLVQGDVLSSLRTVKMPTPGTPGRAWIRSKNGLRSFVQSVNKTALSEEQGTNFAERMAQSMSRLVNTATAASRELVAHAVPKGPIDYMNPHLPEATYNYVAKLTGDIEQAKTIRSLLVSYRARANVDGIKKVFDQIDDLFYAKHPEIDRAATSAPDPFNAILESEAAAYGRFPAEPLGPWTSPVSAAKNINHGLNKMAQVLARLVITGLPFPVFGGASLFWKHTVGDTLRRAAGGGIKLTSDTATRAEITALADQNPALSRLLGVAKSRTTLGETRWINGAMPTQARSFRVGPLSIRDDTIGKTITKQKVMRGYYTAAGAYVRRMLDTKALAAYQQSAKQGDLSDLTNFILRDKEARRAWKGFSNSITGGISAEEFAQVVYQRFDEFTSALHAQNLDWEDAQNAYSGSRGAYADKKLGQWIADHKLSFDVYKGQVTQTTGWDAVTSKMVSAVMTFNKLNRGRMFDNLLSDWYKANKAAGFTEEDALRAAVETAEKQTVFHMLDFANRLQVEQDLRWVSYFATKHRLYWKWVIGLAARYPGYTAAITDFADLLGDNNSINLTVAGQKISIPAGRLVWVNTREYPEESAIYQAAVGIPKNGFTGNGLVQTLQQQPFGTLFTRHDQTVDYAIRLARAETGHLSAAGAVAGLSEDRARALNYRMNLIANEYYADHGVYPSEDYIVKRALVEATADEFWRAAMPLPVMPEQVKVGGVHLGVAPTASQKKLHEFLDIVDPAKRRAYLEKNPDVQLMFGIRSDPRSYQHDRSMWAAWTRALDDRDAVRVKLWEQAKQTGMYTAQMRAERRAADAKLSKIHDQLLVQDARWAGVEVPKGQIPDGKRVGYGPWGTQVAPDSVMASMMDVTKLYPGLPKNQLVTRGASVDKLRDELKSLNDPDIIASYKADPASPDYDPVGASALKDRRNQILDEINMWRGYPTDPLAKAERAYQQQTTSYWKWYDAERNRLRDPTKVGKDTADAEYAHFRAERDARDKPVKIDGITFPSPQRMAWASLAPEQRDQRLAQIADADWAHLTDFEKELLLGHTFVKDGSEVWAALEDAKAAYKKANPGERLTKEQLRSAVLQVDKQYPGFAKDYAFSLKSKAERFQQTVVYRGMPKSLRGEYDSAIGKPALAVVKGIEAGSWPRAYVRTYWHQYVQTQLLPWLEQPEQRDLKQKIDAIGGIDFLNTLPEGGYQVDTSG